MFRLIVLCSTFLLFTHVTQATEESVTESAKKNCEQGLVSDPFALHAHAFGLTINMNSLEERLQLLSGEKPLEDGVHLTSRGGSGNRMLVRMLLFEMITRMGYKAVFQSFQGMQEGANLVVEIEGSTFPDEVVEITAHYDSVGNPGADDNGSGIALMLELLNHYRDASPARTLRFVFMDLEEQGFRGSMYNAHRIKTDSRTFIGSIVVDTIGWHLEGGQHYLAVMEVGSFRDTEAYRKRLRFARELNYVMKRVGNREALVISGEKEGAKPFTADHGSYWDKDIPAVLIAAAYEDGFINPHYHRDGDKIENMNWSYYRYMSQTIAEMLAYVSRTTLKNPDAIGDRGWEVIRGLENTKVTLNSPELEPTRAERTSALPPDYKPAVRSGWFTDDSDDENEGWRTHTPQKPSRPLAPPMPVPPGMPRYLESFLSRIPRHPVPGTLHLFRLPKGFHSTQPSDKNSGFMIWMTDTAVDMVSLHTDSDEVYEMAERAVVQRNGRSHLITQINDNLKRVPLVDLSKQLATIVSELQGSYQTPIFQGREVFYGTRNMRKRLRREYQSGARKPVVSTPANVIHLPPSGSRALVELRFPSTAAVLKEYDELKSEKPKLTLFRLRAPGELNVRTYVLMWETKRPGTLKSEFQPYWSAGDLQFFEALATEVRQRRGRVFDILLPDSNIVGVTSTTVRNIAERLGESTIYTEIDKYRIMALETVKEPKTGN